MNFDIQGHRVLPATGGQRKGRWAGWEVNELAKLYGARDDAALARRLGRPVKSVRARAKEFFESKESRSGQPWTADEDSHLKMCYGVSPPSVISMVLRRTPDEIAARLDDLGRTVTQGEWTSEETKKLKAMYGSRADAVLSVVLSRGIQDIRNRADILRLAKDKAFMRRDGERCMGREEDSNGQSGAANCAKMPRWTPIQVATLVERYPNLSNVEIAKIIGKSSKSVMSKANDLGLRKCEAFLARMGADNVKIRYEKLKKCDEQPTKPGAVAAPPPPPPTPTHVREATASE